MSVWVGLVAAMAACSVLSVLLNCLVYAPFQRRGSSPITLVIVSLGMALIIEFGIQADRRRRQRLLLDGPGQHVPGWAA